MYNKECEESEKQISSLVHQFLDVMNRLDKPFYQIDDYTALVVDDVRYDSYGDPIYTQRYTLHMYGENAIDIYILYDVIDWNCDKVYRESFKNILFDLVCEMKQRLRRENGVQ